MTHIRVQFYFVRFVEECSLSVADLSMTTEHITLKHNETSVPDFSFKWVVEFGA